MSRQQNTEIVGTEEEVKWISDVFSFVFFGSCPVSCGMG
jgi:hypothetical protein